MEHSSREELNEKAHQLAKRAQLFSESLHILSHGQFSPDSGGGGEAEDLLRDDCKELQTEIDQVKAECTRLPKIPNVKDEDSPLSLQLQLHRTMAELTVWQKQKANVLSTSGAITEADIHQQLRENLEQLQLMLAMIRGQKVTARKQLEREQQLLRESHQIRDALRKRLSSLGEGQMTTPTGSSESEQERRLKEAEEECASLKKKLETFVSEYILQPSELEGEEEEEGDEAVRTRRRRRHGGRQTTLDSVLTRQGRGDEENQLPNLAAVIQSLINKCLETPHDPYLPTASIWPPHFHLLLRSGILQRHPDNPTLVRITPFHH